uniref:Maspardin n=1 Tax=Castor canadensis TaxID=51338 RepID=A0A8B7URC8_CASCN
MSQISPQHSDESTLYFTGKEDYAQQARTKLHLSAGHQHEAGKEKGAWSGRLGTESLVAPKGKNLAKKREYTRSCSPKPGAQRCPRAPKAFHHDDDARELMTQAGSQGLAPPLGTRKREARAGGAEGSGGGRRRPGLVWPRAPPLGGGRPLARPCCACGSLSPRPPLPPAFGHLRRPSLNWSGEPPRAARKGTWGRPRQIIVDDDDSKIWSLYDAGPRSIRCPLIFLPPVSGTADVFFQQILALTGWGYRVIALQYPVYWDHLEFCDGFRKLLDHLQLDKVHLFGASLGGFLAQKFAEYTHKSPRVHSLILCNSFSDTSIFNQTWTAN